MSGETERNVSGWTVDTLKQHMDQRFIESDERLRIRITTAEAAVNKAEVATEKRFEGVNEFRKTLSDQTATFMSRLETEQRVNALAEKIVALTDRLNMSDGQEAGSKITMGRLYSTLAGFGTIISIVVVLGNQYINSNYRTATAQAQAAQPQILIDKSALTGKK